MIKNLLFDCGGVVFDVDYEKSYLEFKKLSSTPDLFNQLSVFGFKHIASDYETGKQSSEEFLKDIRKKLNLIATDQEIVAAWNSMLVGYLEDSVDVINNLKKRFKVALFSNTNEIHYIAFSPICQKLLQTFDRNYFSHQIGYKKPNLEAFQFVLKDSGFIQEETIFIDDSAENIYAAEKLGIRTIHYTKDWNFEKLTDFLMNL